VLKACQLLATGSRALPWGERALHTRRCPRLTPGFPNLMEQRSTAPSGCCWQPAPGWCLQVLSLPSPTCGAGSDLAVTRNGARPHIQEKAEVRQRKDERGKGQRRGRLVPAAAPATTSTARWCWDRGARPAPPLMKTAGSLPTPEHTSMGSNESSNTVRFQSSRGNRAF